MDPFVCYRKYHKVTNKYLLFLLHVSLKKKQKYKKNSVCVGEFTWFKNKKQALEMMIQ